METEFKIDSRSKSRAELWEAVCDIFSEQLRDFRPPIRCSIAFADGSICELRQDKIEAQFEPLNQSYRESYLGPGRPCNIMFVDRDGRELNVRMTVGPSARS